MNIDERLEAITMNLELLSISHAKTEMELRRAIRLSVQDARNHRRRHEQEEASEAKRRAESEELATRRHAELETLFKKFMERKGNGKH